MSQCCVLENGLSWKNTWKLTRGLMITCMHTKMHVSSKRGKKVVCALMYSRKSKRNDRLICSFATWPEWSVSSTASLLIISIPTVWTITQSCNPVIPLAGVWNSTHRCSQTARNAFYTSWFYRTCWLVQIFNMLKFRPLIAELPPCRFNLAASGRNAKIRTKIMYCEPGILSMQASVVGLQSALFVFSLF